MSSLYGKYIKEREGTEILEWEQGFATYKFLPDGVYIVDIYVEPDFRKEGVAAKLADVIAESAKSKGYNKMYGTVCPQAIGATDSLKVLLAYGFSLFNATPSLIYMVKDI